MYPLIIVVLLCFFGTLKCEDCSATISMDDETAAIVRLLGTNAPRVFPYGLSGNNICFEVPVYDLNGCQVATASHCGITQTVNECENALSTATDIFTFNDGATITFGGVYGVSPVVAGADGADSGRVIIAIDAMNDNIVNSTGGYEGVTGSRSAIGFVTFNQDGTADLMLFLH
eukprot:UN09200